MQAAYNAAKSAVIHLCTYCSTLEVIFSSSTDSLTGTSLSVEWVRFARANTVSRGYIATDISTFVTEETKKIWCDKLPMGREGAVHELKGAYLYLASDASTNTTGADIVWSMVATALRRCSEELRSI